jgi:hypothetical protein
MLKAKLTLAHLQWRRLSLRYAALMLTDHNYTFFGAQYRACNLTPSSFGLPLPVLPEDFAKLTSLYSETSGNILLISTVFQRKAELASHGVFRNQSVCVLRSISWCTFITSDWVVLHNYAKIKAIDEKYQYIRVSSIYITPYMVLI